MYTDQTLPSDCPDVSFYLTRVCCVDIRETSATVSGRCSSSSYVDVSTVSDIRTSRHPAAFCTQSVSQVCHLPYCHDIPSTLEVNAFLSCVTWPLFLHLTALVKLFLVWKIYVFKLFLTSKMFNSPIFSFFSSFFVLQFNIVVHSLDFITLHTAFR